MYFNCHTHFSFKYGTLSIHDLFEEAKRCGVKKLVLTDINNTSGYIEMLRICKERKQEFPLEFAVGIEFHQDDELRYIAIAQNNEGFAEINGYLSHHHNQEQPLLSRAPDFEHVVVVYPWNKVPPEALKPNEYCGLKIGQINQLFTSPYRHHLDKLVAWHPVSFKDKMGHNIHRLLRAVHHNTILSKLAPHQQAQPGEVMMPLEELKQYYAQYPEIVRNTERIVADCEIDFELGTDKNKRSLHGSKAADFEYLKKEARAGYRHRYRSDDPIAEERFERELKIISQKSFEAYYLISYDIVKYARHKNFEYVGRGSGANSLVSYCLGITNVDPIELDLYFERFLNPERSSPPDFDIDFSWKDRDEVTQYIFDQHGRQHTALLATHVTYKGRSIIRELGKVFGLPKSEIDAIVEYPDEHRNKDDITRMIFRYAQRMYEMPANLSIHAGGVLITEEPIYHYTATDLPPKGFPITHFEMHNAEDMGIYKFDILSQRGLGHIKDTVNLVKHNRNRKIDINRFDQFKRDPEIKELLRKGRTMGCFYVESPAMRMLLGKLRCEDYPTLVAASSIIRPGVARSGMMRAYIERHHSNGDYDTIHPQMDELMKETYGVMVYQEDVIKVAHHFAGLTLAEADILRRGMSGKYRSRKEFKRVEEQFFKNCEEKGYPPHVTNRVWFEIESFSGYSFSKGHSASYAVESFQSLYLKAHFPLEFMVGVINNFGGFYRTEFYFHEARMSGAMVEPPSVNHSLYFTTIVKKTIYIGFVHLKSLETKIGQLIEEERAQNGNFVSLDNFIRRIPIGLEQIRLLIRVGAFRFTMKTKRELLWDAYLYFGKKRKTRHYTTDLFNEEATHYQLPKLVRLPLEDAFDEIELLGFPLCDPFLLLETENRGDTRSIEMIQKLLRKVEMVGYLVTTKNTSTKDGHPMNFGTFYDHEGQVFDTVHFPNITRKYPFRGKGFYRMKGTIVEDFGYPMMEVEYMEKLPMVSKEQVGVKLLG